MNLITTGNKPTKQEKIEECNFLITSIASHGRKFFRHGDSVSKLELGFQGRVYYIDSYTNKRIYTHRRYSRWGGFTEGGTLKSLIEAMRDYIIFDTRIRFGCICAPDFYSDGGNVWGYDPLEAEKLRESVVHLRMFNWN